MVGEIKQIKVAIGELPDAAAHEALMTRTFVGRTAWALDNLIRAGGKGCTPIDTPGPRWSDYVHKIRRAGVVVETIDEKHAGAYSGTHARYVLRSPVTVLDEVRA